MVIWVLKRFSNHCSLRPRCQDSTDVWFGVRLDQGCSHDALHDVSQGTLCLVHCDTGWNVVWGPNACMPYQVLTKVFSMNKTKCNFGFLLFALRLLKIFSCLCLYVYYVLIIPVLTAYNFTHISKNFTSFEKIQCLSICLTICLISNKYLFDAQTAQMM